MGVGGGISRALPLAGGVGGVRRKDECWGGEGGGEVWVGAGRCSEGEMVGGGGGRRLKNESWG